ncbi:hypothetical protein QZH41_011287 [Actinostola sp. cb2023]|nr:hypothetical protein QZH41_011287 [Actinostola sp. cb2023]
MSKRQELKIFEYALSYFIETDEIAIIKRSQVLEGFQNNIRKDEYVKVKWQSKAYFARVIDVAGKEEERKVINMPQSKEIGIQVGTPPTKSDVDARLDKIETSLHDIQNILRKLCHHHKVAGTGTLDSPVLELDYVPESPAGSNPGTFDDMPVSRSDPDTGSCMMLVPGSNPGTFDDMPVSRSDPDTGLDPGTFDMPVSRSDPDTGSCMMLVPGSNPGTFDDMSVSSEPQTDDHENGSNGTTESLKSIKCTQNLFVLFYS